MLSTTSGLLLIDASVRARCCGIDSGRKPPHALGLLSAAALPRHLLERVASCPGDADYLAVLTAPALAASPSTDVYSSRLQKALACIEGLYTQGPSHRLSALRKRHRTLQRSLIYGLLDALPQRPSGTLGAQPAAQVYAACRSGRTQCRQTCMRAYADSDLSLTVALNRS